MSRSIGFEGSAEEVAKKLNSESTRLTGQSKIEFDSALPFILGLIGENYLDSAVAPDYSPVKLSLSANGSGSMKDGKEFARSCQVTLRRL